MRCLESSFDVLSCADLLHWIRDAGKTGEICASHDGTVRRVYVADGRIVACSSNEPYLRLGTFLVAHGWIDARALKECTKRQEASGRSLGDLLVEQGRITEIDLQSTAIARAEEMIFGLFDWPRGIFRFEADLKPPHDALQIEMTVETAVLAGARRQDELVRIRSVFHSPHFLLRKSRGEHEPPSVPTHLERRLYESIDGKRTLAGIARLCGTSEYVAGRVLSGLVELGLVHLKSVRGPEADFVDGATALNRLRELLAAGEYEAAIEWIDRCGLEPGGDEFLAMAIAKAEAGFMADAYRTQVPPDAVPRRLRADEPPGREAEFLGHDDVLLLDLVDGQWDVRSLCWIAPIPKIDVVRGLLRLRKHGCIELPQPRMDVSSSPEAPPHTDRPASAGNALADIERAVGELGS